MATDSSIEAALRSLKHPKNPETTYAFSFTDYMAAASVDREDVKIFLGAVANDLESKLPLQIDTIGVFTGYSEFDAYERHDYYAQPGPATTWQSRHSEESPKLINPKADELEAYYSIAPHTQSRIELATNPDGSNGQLVKLWGGSLTLKGALQIPSSPELTEQIAKGYISPHLLEVNLWSKNEEERMESSSVITIERTYATEAHFLDQPYLPH